MAHNTEIDANKPLESIEITRAGKVYTFENKYGLKNVEVLVESIRSKKMSEESLFHHVKE